MLHLQNNGARNIISLELEPPKSHIIGEQRCSRTHRPADRAPSQAKPLSGHTGSPWRSSGGFFHGASSRAADEGTSNMIA
ncbi:MAG: hypothetical protein AAFP28_13680, partial [Pseudomonadota bacterium]